jgi:hypothetical protein
MNTTQITNLKLGQMVSNLSSQLPDHHSSPSHQQYFLESKKSKEEKNDSLSPIIHACREIFPRNNGAKNQLCEKTITRLDLSLKNAYLLLNLLE